MTWPHNELLIWRERKGVVLRGIYGGFSRSGLPRHFPPTVPWTKLAGSFMSFTKTNKQTNKHVKRMYTTDFYFYCILFSEYSQSKCHQTSWLHKNLKFLFPTKWLLKCGRSQGTQCRPCTATVEVYITNNIFFILISGAFCNSTLPSLGYPSLKTHSQWHWDNLATPLQKRKICDAVILNNGCFFIQPQSKTYDSPLTFPQTISSLISLGHLIKMSAAWPLVNAG